MDVKEARKIAERQGGVLLGFHAIPVPIYRIYVSYESFDNNPFFPLQKALLRYVDEVSKSDDNKFVAALLGVDENLVKQTYEKLREDGFILSNPDTGEKELTEDARRKYLKYGARPSVNKEGAFFVDGKSLDFFLDEINQLLLKAYGIQKEKYFVSHRPIILDENPKEKGCIEQKLEKRKVKLEALNLDKEGKDFKVVDLEPLMLSDVYLVYMYVDGKMEKKAYIHNLEIETAATKDVLDFTFCVKQKGNTWVLDRNLGYNANEETKNKYIDGSADTDEGWNVIVNEFYGIHNSNISPIEYDSESQLYFIRITHEMVDNSNSPRKIIGDCCMEYPCVLLPMQGGGGVQFELRPEIEDYLRIEHELLVLPNDYDVDELIYKLNMISSKWRSVLLSLGREQELENIDIKQFIHSL